MFASWATFQNKMTHSSIIDEMKNFFQVNMATVIVADKLNQTNSVSAATFMLHIITAHFVLWTMYSCPYSGSPHCDTQNILVDVVRYTLWYLVVFWSDNIRSWPVVDQCHCLGSNTVTCMTTNANRT